MSSIDWGDLVERRIQEAQEQGLFDDLPGKGRPLDLSENPFLDRSWRLAYKLLQDSGFTLDWIELDKEIRAELAACRQALARARARYDEAQTGLKGKVGPQAEGEKAQADISWQRALASFAERANKLNKKIDLFNLKVPLFRLQRPRISVEEEQRRLGITDPMTF